MRTLMCSLVGLCLLFLTGCWTHTWLSEGRIWPKRPSFTIVPPTNQVAYQTSGVSYDAVYVYSNACGEGYNFLRFWPNGRVMIRPTPQIPTLEDAESFTNAYIGYFRVEGSKLFTEFFLPAGSPPWASGYHFIESIIDGDKIVDIRSKFNDGDERDLKKNNMINTKHPMPGMKRQPDW